MSKQIRKPYVIWFMIAASAVFFTLVVLRALRLAITHDEAYTYIHYVKQSWLGILLYKPPHIPNNHILNTLLAKISVYLFGLSDFNLRLPNVLFSLIYFRYAAAIARKFRFPGIQILAFLAICLQVYFFDFFAMARGYGMGIALSLASIFHFYSYRELNNGHHIWRTLLFAAFAVYANFTFLYSYLALVGLFLFFYWSEGDKQTKSLGVLWRPVSIVTGALAVLIALPLKNISGDLFGGDTHFWKDTVGSLSWSMQYGQSHYLGSYINIGIAFLLLAGLTLFIFNYRTKAEKRIWYYSSDLWLWLILTALAQISQHFILGTQFLMGRTALVYAPLFIVFVPFLLQRLNAYPRGESYQLILSLVWVSLMALNFSALNLKKSFEWPYDANNKVMLKDLKDSKAILEDDFKLGINWLFEPSLNFYQESENLEWLRPLSRGGYKQDTYDAYYLLRYKDQEFIAALEKKDSGFILVGDYDNEAVLYIRKDYL